MFKFVIIYLIIISNVVYSYSSKYDSIYSNMNSYISQMSLFNQLIGSKSGFIRLMSDVNIYNKKITLTEYDFIIVGAGPAGCVLANRLSEESDWKILLIDAGKAEDFVVKIPSAAGYMQATDYSIPYTAEKDNRFCWGMDDGICSFPRGKGMGGTSLINYMIYNRGNRRDFDRWEAAGNPGWSYKDVLPYFIKIETANLRGLENSPYHGRNGYLSVEDVRYRSPLVEVYIDAAKQSGHVHTDYNGERQLGVSYVQASTKVGERHTAANAYLTPIVGKRKNLHVLSHTKATKILINEKTKTAYGVEMVNKRKSYRIYARNEVILSAGAFSSPQLLMLSGIGPRKHLRQIDIPVIQDLPVGELMYDHLCHVGPVFTVNTTEASLHTSRLLRPHNLINYMNKRNGPATLIGGVEGLTFIKTPNSKEPADFPDSEIIFIGGALSSDQGTGIRRGWRITDDVYNSVYKSIENPDIDTWSVLVMHFHPKSKGFMKLRDNNPFHWPLFYPNYFDDEDDLETILHGIKETIRISQAPAMQRIGTRIHDVPLPNCAYLGFGTDNYWRCSIRTLSATLHHQVGTTKMGPPSDPTSVVNHQLKVYGIGRLRVADCGIIPFPPTAHTNAASFMIGEKAADMIKQEWGRQIRY